MPHPCDVDYFWCWNDTPRFFPTYVAAVSTSASAESAWGVPYIAVCCVCVRWLIQTLQPLFLSLPHTCGGWRTVSVCIQCLYCPPCPSVAIGGTLITSYLTCLFILYIHDNIIVYVHHQQSVESRPLVGWFWGMASSQQWTALQRSSGACACSQLLLCNYYVIVYLVYACVVLVVD